MGAREKRQTSVKHPEKSKDWEGGDEEMRRDRRLQVGHSNPKRTTDNKET